jgi:hypothetical protein
MVSLRSARRSVDGEVRKNSRKRQCRNCDRSAAEVLHAVKFSGVRRSSSGSSPGGGARTANGAAEAQRAKALSTKKWRMREEEEEGAVSPYKGRGRSGPKTAGPRWFGSWAATVRSTGHHVAWRYTRKNRRPQGSAHGSRAEARIRYEAVNARAEAEGK